ncbi:MAG: TfoX/Sxy family protein [Clostridia bacterium]|nr:TfoX/Sxy family protein [Clostridia bacterium]
MATSVEYIEYVCEQIRKVGEVRYKKMFGEYMVYVNDKPVLLVCDDTVYVKMLDVVSEDMSDAPKGIPYKGSKEHYILDIDNSDLAVTVVEKLEKVTPLPKPRKKKEKETFYICV